MKWVYIFCGHSLPTAHPNGIRMANIGLIFKELGYEVLLVGCEIGEKEKNFMYKGMHCNLFPIHSTRGLRKAMEREETRYQHIANLVHNKKPDVVISCLFNCRAQRFLMSFCKKTHIPMIQSVCEWFDKNEYKGLAGGIKFLNNRFSMYYQFPQIGNIIAISSLLNTFYEQRGCQTVCIPTLTDMSEYQNLPYHGGDKRIIAYAGSPAKKDYITNIVMAVEQLSNEERQKFELHLYGTEKKQLIMLGVTEEYLVKYQDTIILHGRIPYEQVKYRIAEADYTILLRPYKRYANAGFPTKVGESMACGTPVIANLTSDLGEYILNKKTGIICKDETITSCVGAIRQALQISGEELKNMRIETKTMAYNCFFYKEYVNKMENFIKKRIISL